MAARRYSLPTRLRIGRRPWRVRRADPGHGCIGLTIGPPDRHITIARGMSRFEAAETFLHELLHAVDFELIEAGIRRRRLPEGWVAFGSPNLLRTLVLAGVWRGLSRGDLPRGLRRTRDRLGRRATSAGLLHE